MEFPPSWRCRVTWMLHQRNWELLLMRIQGIFGLIFARYSLTICGFDMFLGSCSEVSLSAVFLRCRALYMHFWTKRKKQTSNLMCTEALCRTSSRTRVLSMMLYYRPKWSQKIGYRRTLDQSTYLKSDTSGFPIPERLLILSEVVLGSCGFMRIQWHKCNIVLSENAI